MTSRAPRATLLSSAPKEEYDMSMEKYRYVAYRFFFLNMLGETSSFYGVPLGQFDTVMEMLVHSHYESMFSSTALVYRRSHICRFECNVRKCAEEPLP